MLTIHHLCKRYGQRPVLNELSLTLQPGEIYGLLGPNGAGKTTTINIVCGLLRGDGGTVTIGGQPAGQATKSLIGVMPQANLLYGGLTCAENLRFFARLYGLSRAVQQRRVAECLAAVNLQAQAQRPAEALSGGMQRRLSLAIAMVHQPPLIILDEPSTGLDVEARYDVWGLIRQLKADGTTVLLTTHLLDEVERLCDHIGILKGGTLAAEGTLEQLRQRIPAQEVITVDTPDPEAAIDRARAHGFTPRHYGTDLAFWVPQALDFQQLAACFAGIPVASIARRPVGLEHVYVEVTRNPEPALARPTAEIG